MFKGCLPGLISTACSHFHTRNVANFSLLYCYFHFKHSVELHYLVLIMILTLILVKLHEQSTRHYNFKKQIQLRKIFFNYRYLNVQTPKRILPRTILRYRSICTILRILIIFTSNLVLLHSTLTPNSVTLELFLS